MCHCGRFICLLAPEPLIIEWVWSGAIFELLFGQLFSWAVYEYSKCQNNKKMPGNIWELGSKARQQSTSVKGCTSSILKQCRDDMLIDPVFSFLKLNGGDLKGKSAVCSWSSLFFNEFDRQHSFIDPIPRSGDGDKHSPQLLGKNQSLTYCHSAAQILISMQTEGNKRLSHSCTRRSIQYIHFLFFILL